MPNTIEENIERLKAVVPAIKNSIITKGGTVNSGDGLEEFADDILSIKNELTDITITSNGKYYSGEETTLTTTTFPVTVLDAVGTPLKHVDVIGNANQSGTPTPDNPIMPQGTGERTENLLPEFYATSGEISGNSYTITKNSIETHNDGSVLGTYYVLTEFRRYGNYANYAIIDEKHSFKIPAGTYTFSGNENIHSGNNGLHLIVGQLGQTVAGATGGAKNIGVGQTFTVDVDSYVCPVLEIRYDSQVDEYILTNPMLNTGSTALPYEPYGIKIPISSNNITTPAYLGEVETVRYVKKLVLDGTEDFQSISSGNNKYFRLSVEDFGGIHIDTTFCTHFESVSITSSTTNVGVGVIHSSVLNKDALGIRPPQVSTTSLEDFTTYLTQQYNNGTPVTVWYVLTTPTRGIINEPLMKIDGYADQLSIDTNIPLEQNTKNIINIDTTLKPSSASFTYNKKGTYIGYNEINVDVSNTYTAGDEGKVVNNATLVSQTAMPTEITVNNTYDTTLYNSITVNVPPPTSTKTDTTGSGIKFIGDGNPLIRCDIEGNMDQQGTPSPSSIIIPDETGDKTTNLFDAEMEQGSISASGSNQSSTARIRTSDFIPLEAGDYVINASASNDLDCFVFIYDTSGTFVERVPSDWTTLPYTFTLSENCKIKVVLTYRPAASSVNIVPSDVSNITLNTGSTALPYQPSGYYLPTECGGTTTPVYLGEVESTRKIKKLVLTGEETWIKSSAYQGSFYAQIVTEPLSENYTAYCSHLTFSPLSQYEKGKFCFNGGITKNCNMWFNQFDNSTTVEDLKSYLAEQYANGTPVCVWYVLANETTGIVNEPIRKIGDYADSVSPTGIPTIAGLNEFRVATALPPSKTTIEYRYIENIPTLDSKTITANGIYDASDDNLDGYSSVNVDVAGGGGGGSNAGVVFYDYDGTIVTSYSAADFANLSELPANPTHEGFAAQGWNWSLADAKAYVANYGSLNIGQMYTTSDGKTRLYISLSDGRTSPILQLYLNDNSELDIDWGDGSTHSTFTATSSEYKSERHEYSVADDYVIAITVVSGGFELQSSSTDVSSILWNGNNQLNSPDRVYDNAIKKIEIGTGVTSIGVKAFYNCSSLSSITIPDNVTSIGDNAFDSCYSLSSITLPDTVISIGNSSFNNCYSLSSVAIPDSVTTISDNAFYSCYSLLSMTIPSDVTSISDNTFCNCSSLSSIIIPNGVTTIGDSAFDSCSSLSSITIPGSVITIGSSAFYNCSSLSSVTIPDGVTTISGSAFSTCYSLSSITLPGTVTSIGIATFVNCKSLTSITISDGVTTIGNNVFSGCSSLTSITIPDSVTSIGNNTFSSCTSLSSITIPNTVTSIGSSAFYNCSSLSSITIPNSVTTIGNSIFSGCSSLSSVTISNKVTSIGMNAFTNCSSLSSITIPDGVTTIGGSVFSGCSSLTSITIPNTVTSIGVGAFSGCSSLSSVTIPDTVTAINGTIFSGCSSLSSITISDKVTSIGANAFSNCAYMSYIKFESTTPPTVSNANAWNGLSTSTKILVPSGTLSTYKSASKYPNPSIYTYEEY